MSAEKNDAISLNFFDILKNFPSTEKKIKAVIRIGVRECLLPEFYSFARIPRYCRSVHIMSADCYYLW